METIYVDGGSSAIMLLVGKNYHTFSMHHYSGPLRLYADEETINENGWSQTAAFWDVFHRWLEQGQRVNEHGIGVVD